MFAWYWVADFCVDHDVAFVLGHAPYMKAIHSGKAKNDRIDAGKLARLLRGGNLPPAYAYPKGMRETRDLLRRRSYLVHKRAELMTHLHILNAQYNLAPFPKKLAYAANRTEMNIAERCSDVSVQKSAAADLAVVGPRGCKCGLLFPVPQGGVRCRGLITEKRGSVCVWPRYWNWSPSRRRRVLLLLAAQLRQAAENDLP